MMKYCHLYSMFNVPYHSKPINSFVKGPPQNLHPLPSSFPLPYILFLCNCGSISLTFSLTSSYTNLVPSHMRSHNQYGSAIQCLLDLLSRTPENRGGWGSHYFEAVPFNPFILHLPVLCDPF